MPKLTAERRRALAVLADCPEGCTESLMLTHGFAPDLLADLIIAGYAIAKRVRVTAGKSRTVEVLRIYITDAGWDALRV